MKTFLTIEDKNCFEEGKIIDIFGKIFNGGEKNNKFKCYNRIIKNP
jgi:hypothetical protein